MAKTSTRKDRRFLFLLLGLISICIIYPFFEDSKYSVFMLYLFLVSLLFYALLCVKPKKSRLIASIILGLSSFITGLLHLYFSDSVSLILNIFITAGFNALIMWEVFKSVISKHDVDAETIFEAASLYFMIGLTWAYFFMFIQLKNPDAFYIAHRNVDGGDLFYYSFVTLTTLGYGDITPVASEARSLAFLESVFGVLYIAILVARLASNFRFKKDIK